MMQSFILLSSRQTGSTSCQGHQVGDDTLRLGLETAWHIEWTFRRSPPLGPDEWHEVADEYFERCNNMLGATGNCPSIKLEA